MKSKSVLVSLDPLSLPRLEAILAYARENGDLTISSVDQNLAQAAREACILLDRLMAEQSKQPKQPDDPNTQTILNRPFGAAETAEAVGVARSTLDHLFTAKLGHSIGSEILRQRLQCAKRMLKDPPVAMKSIAAACGFCNASYFTNVFRRETGLTPRNWRRCAPDR